MKRNWVKIIYIFAMWAILYYGLNIGFVQQHEAVHQVIYESYNISSEVHIDYFYVFKLKSVAGYTSANKKEVAERCTEACRMLQEQNEIVSYNDQMTWQTIMILSFFWLLYQVFIKRTDFDMEEIF